MEHNCLLTAYYTGKQQPFLHTVHDLINAWGVYLILGVQVGVFNRQEVFILVTVTKLMCFWQKYPVYQLIRLGLLEVLIALSNPNNLMSESLLRVIVLPLLVYPYL